MFINQKTVDNYLSKYNNLTLTIHFEYYCIKLRPYKKNFLLIVFNKRVPIEQYIYNSWDIATYNFNALSCKYMELATKIYQEEPVNK